GLWPGASPASLEVTTMTPLSIGEQGVITTFYSYKGGTGRTMALANYACYLARQKALAGQRILLIDWDLEAPGLHRYFASRAEFTVDAGPPGVIDYFTRIRDALRLSQSKTVGEDHVWLNNLVPFGDFVIRDVYSDQASVDLMRAGRFGPHFVENVLEFQW